MHGDCRIDLPFLLLFLPSAFLLLCHQNFWFQSSLTFVEFCLLLSVSVKPLLARKKDDKRGVYFAILPLLATTSKILKAPTKTAVCFRVEMCWKEVCFHPTSNFYLQTSIQATQLFHTKQINNKRKVALYIYTHYSNTSW